MKRSPLTHNRNHCARRYIALLIAPALVFSSALSLGSETTPAAGKEFLAALGCGRVAPDQPALAPVLIAGPYSVLLIGSSSTDGIGASRAENGYPARTGFHLNQQEAKAPIVFDARGIGGEKADAALTRLTEGLASSRPDVLVWQVGTNDALANVPLSSLGKTIEEGLARARQQAVPVVLIDPQHFPRIEDNKHYADTVTLIGKLAGEHGIPVVHRYQRMRQAIAMDASLATALLAADGLHMSDLGHECLARDLAAVLAPAFANDQTSTVASAGKAKP